MTHISLEMTSPEQLVPGRTPPTPITLDEVGAESAPLIRTLYNRIFPSGRTAWTVDDWTTELSEPGIHTRIARIDDTPAGIAELAAEPSGAVGIVIFGLVPEFQSQGYGAAFLTLTTNLAWNLNQPTTRVWLQTSTRDHPHALPNYQSRGFRLITP